MTVYAAASNICDILKMGTREICAYWKACQFVSDDLILLLKVSAIEVAFTLTL